MGSKLRVGLIGVGGVGRLHYETYKTAENIQVVAVCDTSADRIAALDLPSNITAFSDAQKMLSNSRLDIACVLTPPSSHEPLVSLCAQHGVHAFCEKPLAPSIEAGERMIAAAEKAGVQLFYGSSYRYLPAIQAARQTIAAGRIGKVRLLKEQSIGGVGLERMQVMHASHYPVGGPGGFAMGMADHGIHLLDVMGWMMDAEIVHSAGRGNRTGEPALPEHLTMVFDNGAVGNLIYDEGTYPTDLPTEGMISEGDGWDADGFVHAGTWTRYPGAIHIYGSHGALRVHHYANRVFLINEKGIREIATTGRPSPYHFAAQIDTFAEDIQTGRGPSTPGIVGLRTLKALLAVYA